MYFLSIKIILSKKYGQKRLFTYLFIVFKTKKLQ